MNKFESKIGFKVKLAKVFSMIGIDIKDLADGSSDDDISGDDVYHQD